jgi:microcystin-dependent protein
LPETIVGGTPYAGIYYQSGNSIRLFGVGPAPGIPLGAGMDFWGTSAPSTAFAFAQGQAISRTTYATLFALVGTTFGSGDGSTTFNIPDKVGRVSAMVDGGGARLSTATLNKSTIGGVGGFETHALSIAEMPVHSHGNSLTDPGHSHVVGFEEAGVVSSNQLGTSTDPQYVHIASTVHTQSATTGITINNANAGSGTAHGIIQPTITCNYIIRII